MLDYENLAAAVKMTQIASKFANLLDSATLIQKRWKILARSASE